ncbi:hypothetical protein BCR42DRAFT_384628 [Absidia repens]|uniref:Uncharacterized protein n=1 Tax=Absidia repens TaxID=90262 RepID=A0A1X2HYW1_9FUNG|nr:hypothetical protein BCR42DRAFT_384628 [Absidia repens]
MAEIRKASLENKRASQHANEVSVTEETDKALISEKLDSISINQQQQSADDTKISTLETTQNQDSATSPTTPTVTADANATTTTSANNTNSPPRSPHTGASETLENQSSTSSTAPATNSIENGDGQGQDNNSDSNLEEKKPVDPPAAPQVHPLVAQLKQQLYQQRHVLDHLEVERSQYRLDNQSLKDRIGQMKTKVQQRTEAQQQLENNYREHLQSMRATPDDLASISAKLKQLKKKIRELADELLEQADPVTATNALRTFWLNLHDCIEGMGNPLPLHRVRMLTEKFMMDVLVQNMNLNMFPGLAISDHYNDLSFWLEKYDTTFASTRLRQEMALVMVKKNTSGSDIHRKLHEAVQSNWKFLYGGLIKAYPFVYQYDKHEPDTQKHYGAKVQILVEHAMTLGFAMKGQEVDVAAAETRERAQLFDGSLMVDEDGQTSGVVDFCVCPPFVVYGPTVYTLEKGRVLCSPAPASSKPSDGKDTKDAYKTDSPTNAVPTSTNNTSPIST